MLAIQNHADVTVVADRHAPAKIVCCWHIVLNQKNSTRPLLRREPQKIAKQPGNASSDLAAFDFRPGFF
jgi:hypothetical protein